MFELQKKEGEGEYQAIMSIQDEGKAKYTGVAGVGADSRFTSDSAANVLSNLPDGSYRLEEISAPSGYVITNKYTEFVIEEGKIKGAGDSLVITIPNTPGVSLPNTGSTGTAPCLRGGLALLLFAALGLAEKARRRA